MEYLNIFSKNKVERIQNHSSWRYLTFLCHSPGLCFSYHLLTLTIFWMYHWPTEAVSQMKGLPCTVDCHFIDSFIYNIWAQAPSFNSLPRVFQTSVGPGLHPMCHPDAYPFSPLQRKLSVFLVWVSDDRDNVEFHHYSQFDFFNRSWNLKGAQCL